MIGLAFITIFVLLLEQNFASTPISQYILIAHIEISGDVQDSGTLTANVTVASDNIYVSGSFILGTLGGTVNLNGTITEKKDIHIKDDTSIITFATYTGSTKLDGSLNSDGNVILNGKAKLSSDNTNKKIRINIYINGTVIPVA